MKLVKNKNNQTGEMVENWKNFGYFSTIKKAMMGIIYKDLLVNNDEIETILDYKQQLDKQYDTILELLKEKQRKKGEKVEWKVMNQLRNMVKFVSS